MILDLVRENAEEALNAREKRKIDPKDLMEETRSLLKRDHPPRTLCCVDISNTGDLFPVASLVTFLDGKPEKSLYRKFRIRYEKGQDDFKMLSEVMERQFRENPLPDLLIIDGGPLQLDACVRTLESMGHGDASRRVLSLAKERISKNKMERIFFPGQEMPLVLPGHHHVTHLLVRLRDEAHRFALKYHRTLREEYLTHSRLLNIPGVGPAREKKLLLSFGSVKGLMEATVEEIALRTGLSEALAASIHQALRERPEDQTVSQARTPS